MSSLSCCTSRRSEREETVVVMGASGAVDVDETKRRLDSVPLVAYI